MIHSSYYAAYIQIRNNPNNLKPLLGYYEKKTESFLLFTWTIKIKMYFYLSSMYSDVRFLVLFFYWESSGITSTQKSPDLSLLLVAIIVFHNIADGFLITCKWQQSPQVFNILLHILFDFSTNHEKIKV